ncbi:tRNA (guanosine(46)-N(7))-methyltransferase TrmB [Aliihoeflea sp. 40Bstr573]|uniref:tRNA (guanine(46)-N(7))-methyltransferase TrmB n=1 Tax=Aliihoeflea sp. 40Bstr573 TaxID=2696467 RepID=UPI0020943502|nr:tRNA (guanine(46)-N(7))-methyltransferase TrmB [Aliihoeflea sp. 40Bstr573]MCO6389128.1 tRNA (guanosine(46)-N7)-methyltransferase TrmB [Aliihoeflea sp. 40Bstr573]
MSKHVWGERATEAFFGRRHGKTMSPKQVGQMATHLPRLKLDLKTPAPGDLRTLFSGTVEEVRLEIGFGGGEHFHHEASRFPRTGFIGVEPFVNGMAKFVSQFDAGPLANVRVHDDDAAELLDWLPSASLAGIDLLYPDPWTKKRHWKRRFVSPVNLDRFARVLQPGGRFRFASDIPHYVNWTLAHCRAHGDFEWQAAGPDDWRMPYDGWPGTRYEAKAIREGRTPCYLTFRRL